MIPATNHCPLLKFAEKTQLHLLLVLVMLVPWTAQADAAKEVDLASDTEWTLSIDAGPERSIKVPAGGYASELQVPTILTQDVKGYVTYQRKITIPNVSPSQVTMIRFGAVNFAYDLLLDGTKVASTEKTPSVMLPSTVDLTGHAKPGNTYTLAVKVYNRWHVNNITPKSFDMEQVKGEKWHAWAPDGTKRWGQTWNEHGITKYVKLAVYPELFVRNLFVNPSVKNDTLCCDVWIHNHGTTEKNIVLQSGLTSWNGHPWAYPALPDVNVTLPPDATTKVTLGPVKWGLGATSYWWPNMPFREDYAAELHKLNLTLVERTAILHTFLFEAESTYDYQCHHTENDPVTVQYNFEKFAEHYRNHPSVARYSLWNEGVPSSKAAEQMLDVLLEHDPTRPVITEGYVGVKTKNGHAVTTQHYTSMYQPVTTLFLMGEHTFEEMSMTLCADRDKWYRYFDLAHTAGWSWLNYWPNLIDGLHRDNHNCQKWGNNTLPLDKVDGKDGWGSPDVVFVQRCHVPYLVMDLFTEQFNRLFSEQTRGYSPKWPVTVLTILPGEKVSRRVEMFNGGLTGNKLALRWTLRWDSATGDVVDSGTVNDIAVEPGFHIAQTIQFTTPDPGKEQRKLYTVWESLRQDTVVYKEDRVYINISRAAAQAPELKFIGVNAETQGNWEKEFGTDGYEIVGKDARKPAYVNLLEWQSSLWWGAKATNDLRALHDPSPGSEQDRIAAARYCSNKMGGQQLPLRLVLDVGENFHNVALYMVDWEKNKRTQTIEVQRFAGEILDTQTVTDFAGGKYLIWRIRGKVVFTVTTPGQDTFINGVFFDPAEISEQSLFSRSPNRSLALHAHQPQTRAAQRGTEQLTECK